MRSLAPALLLAATLMGSVDDAEENVRSIAYATRFAGSQYVAGRPIAWCL